MAINYKNYLTNNIGTGSTTIYNPTTAGIQSTVQGLVLCNTSAVTINVTVTLTSGATTIYLIKGLGVLSGTSVDILSGSKLVVEQNDSLAALSSVATSLDVCVSAVEIT
jgi:hypothetical protein